MVPNLRSPAAIAILSLVSVLLLSACAPGTTPCRVWSTPVPVSKALADGLEAKVEKEIGSHKSGPFRLEITQEEATSYAALNLRGYPIEKPEIRFSEGLVHLSGSVTAVGPIRGNLSASFLPQLSGGLVALQLQEACLNGLAVPSFLRSRIERLVNDSIADAKPYVTIRQLEIQEGKIIVAGDIIRT